MSKKEIMEEIRGNIQELESYFKKLEQSMENNAKENLNPSIKGGVYWLINAQNEDGGFGIKKNEPSNIHLTAFALFALSKAGLRAGEDEAIDKALKYLKKTQNEEGWWGYEEDDTIGSVGVTSMVIQAFNILGIKRSEPFYKKALNFIYEQFSFERGCWRDNTYSEFGELSVNELAFGAIEGKLKGTKLEKFRELVIESINPDNGYGWKFGDSESDIENTAIALKILKRLGFTTKDDLVKRAIRYILNSQDKTGGFPRKMQFYGNSDAIENDTTALVISGLITIGLEPYHEAILKAIDFLNKQQNCIEPKGTACMTIEEIQNTNWGWGWGDKAGMPSDTDSTSLALTALIDAGKGAVPLAVTQCKIAETREFVNKFIERHVNELYDELKHMNRLNRLLELNIAILAILIPIITIFLS
ncbi:MAG: prenyltransferase/squalene oxidase repeat-containing protein [Candidatus Helarchaeota archaeon]